MDSLANYGSDDDYDDNSDHNSAEDRGAPTGKRASRLQREADANYDEVQMDLSEESNSNYSPDRNDASRDNGSKQDQRRSYTPVGDRKKLPSTSTSRDDNKPKDENRSHDRNDHSRRRYEDDRRRDDRREKSKYERSSTDSEDRKSPKSRDDKYKSRNDRNGRSDQRRSNSRDRKRSSSREPRRSGSRERRRSRERNRSRSPHYRRSSSRDRRSAKRYDRSSNKMAHLEKMGIEIKTPDSKFVTPQMLLGREEKEEKSEMPKYCNFGASSSRYMEQIQKRKLLWQKKDPEKTDDKKPAAGPSGGKMWQYTTFAQDNDGKVASKFKRLMGIKDAQPAAKEGGSEIMKKQEEMFSSMEQQYEVARTATHTMRGVGLGFGSYQYPR